MTMTVQTTPQESQEALPGQASYRYTFDAHSSRVVAVFNREIIAESLRTRVMKETRLPPVYYFPREDVRMDLARRTRHRTHCPFKGNASYWSFEVGGKLGENLMWGYEEATEEASELREYVAFYVDQLDSLDDAASVTSSSETPLRGGGAGSRAGRAGSEIHRRRRFGDFPNRR